MNNIDVTILSSYKNMIKEEKLNYELNTYNIFKNSYLNTNNNLKLNQTVKKISDLYDKILLDYEKIYKWLDSYIENAVALENNLANNGSIGDIKESSIRNYVQSKIKEF